MLSERTGAGARIWQWARETCVVITRCLMGLGINNISFKNSVESVRGVTEKAVVLRYVNSCAWTQTLSQTTLWKDHALLQVKWSCSLGMCEKGICQKGWKDMGIQKNDDWSVKSPVMSETWMKCPVPVCRQVIATFRTCSPYGPTFVHKRYCSTLLWTNVIMTPFCNGL